MEIFLSGLTTAPLPSSFLTIAETSSLDFFARDFTASLLAATGCKGA